MNVAAIISVLEQVAPPSLAETWDNVGLQVGDAGAETNACLLCLDVSPETIREARSVHAGLIICHHPVIMSPLAAVTTCDPVGETVLAAARARMSIYVAHTNLDAAPCLGTAAALARRLGLQPGPPLVPCRPGLEGDPVPVGETPLPPGTPAEAGLGMVCDVPPMPLAALAEYCAGKLGRRDVGVVGDGGLTVRRVALLPGSGGGLVEHAVPVADALITGEIKYHDALHAQALGLGVVAAGHYDTERPVLDGLARFLKERMGTRLGIAVSQLRTDPVSTWLENA